MAVRIPQYTERNAIRATPTPTRSINYRGVQNAGLDRLASALGNVAGVIKEKDDEDARVWVAQALPQFNLERQSELEELKKTTAPGAEGFAQTFASSYNEKAKALRDAAPNDSAKRLLDANLARGFEHFGSHALNFQRGEQTRYQSELDANAVQSAATLVHSDPSQFESQIVILMDGLKSSRVYTPEQKAKMGDAMRKELVNASVMSWIDRNPMDASKILEDATKGKDAAPDIRWTENGQTYSVPFKLATLQEREAFMKHAKTAKAEAESRQFAGAFIESAKGVVSAMPLQPGDMVDLPAAKAAAVSQAESRLGTKLQPDQVLRLESYVEQVAADRERDVKRGRESVLASGFTALEQNGGDYQALVRDRQDILRSLDDTQKLRLNEHAGKVATGALVPTDWQAYGELVANPALLKSTNLEAMKDKMNSHELSQLQKMQKALLENPGNEQNLVSTHSLVKGMLTEAGFKKNPKKEGQFFSLLQQAVDQELLVTGKKALPQTRVKEIASDLLVKEVTSRGILFDSKDEAFEIKVPDTERVKIEVALREMGMPINDYNVLNAYRNKLRKLNAPK